MNTFFVCLNLLLCIQKDICADTTLIFNGNIVDTQTDKIVMISCVTLDMAFECSLEFLHNNSTVESIRYSDGGCYDKSGKCKPGICSCSEDCTTFHWNFTSKVVKPNDSFGCQMRIYNSTFNSFYKVYTLAVYNGTGFMLATSIIYQVDMVSTIVQTTPSLSKEKIEGWIIGTICGVAVAVLIIIAVCCLCRRYIRNKKACKGMRTSSERDSDVPISDLSKGSNITEIEL